ncbi:MAG: HEAT repeat domain-containing protein [Dehalococcoidia bacterium]|nr:HEAT repeat domain-containing protein [Dehalococcoidia bacterium]
MAEPESNPASKTKEIESLIAQFTSDSDAAREKARLSLVSMGEQAVVPLIGALRDRRLRIRWEAAKALGQIGNPLAAPALVEALEDPEFDVRWLSAEGLVSIGRAGLEAMLTALTKRPESLWLRESAHHLLAHVVGEDTEVNHHLADHPVSKETRLRDVLKPVMAAIHGSHPVMEIPMAAAAALNELKRAGQK